jgi:hypothetical protein
MTVSEEPKNVPAMPSEAPRLRMVPSRITAKAEGMCEQHDLRAQELRYRAERVVDQPVRGVRGGIMVLGQAAETGEQIRLMIEYEEAGGSLRHRSVPWLTKWMVWTVVVLIDFPIMTWASASIFNVDWSYLWGVRLLFAVATAVLATLASASALHHLGHELREQKTDSRGLAWSQLRARSRAILIAVVLLVLLVALLMFARVYAEGVLSGLDTVATLLAALVAFVMLISATLVFWTAFRDGSPESDDLAYYTDLVEHHLNKKRALESGAAWHERQSDLIRRRAGRSTLSD